MDEHVGTCKHKQKLAHCLLFDPYKLNTGGEPMLLPKTPIPRYSTRFGHTRNDNRPKRIGRKGDPIPLDRRDINDAVVAHFWEQFERRFWAHVVKGSQDECWEWRGTKRTGGYGFLRVWVLQGNPEIKASRIAWLLVHGSVPVDQLLCHRCDNPACVNVAHLFLGTHTDNSQDMIRKGRKYSTAGTNNGNAILTPAAVLEIRQLLASKVTVRDIALRHGVGIGVVYSIKYNRAWKQVA